MMNVSTSSVTKHKSVLNIQDCLEQTPANMLLDNPVSIGGTLVRQRFNFRKLKIVQGGQQKDQHKRYEGWTFVLCHSAEDALEVASVLQTVEVRISVPFDRPTEVKSDALNLALLRIFASETREKPQTQGPKTRLCPSLRRSLSSKGRTTAFAISNPLDRQRKVNSFCLKTLFAS